MGINPSDSSASELMFVREIKDTVTIEALCLRQQKEHLTKLHRVGRVPQQELPRNEGMLDDLRPCEKRDKFRFNAPEVIDPDRGINEDHAGRRLSATEKSGIVPPRPLRKSAAWR